LKLVKPEALAQDHLIKDSPWNFCWEKQPDRDLPEMRGDLMGICQVNSILNIVFGNGFNISNVL
jgi:hypothetical protein